MTAYKLHEPLSQTTGVVFASPHSGREYSPAFLARSQLDAVTIRSSEDAYVDQIFGCAPEFGAPLLAANAPRAYVDLNRGPEEMDPALIAGARPGGHNNPRVTSGLGVIPRVVANSRPIYRGKLTQAEAQDRLSEHWHPYHATLKQMLLSAREQFGRAILIDCHSMPHEAMDNALRVGRRRPEIVLGDRFGATADSDIIEEIEAIFAGAGFAVVRNAPFAGAYIAQTYGRPSRDQHVVQIEIDRALYLNEKTVEPRADFDDFVRHMRPVIRQIAQLGEANLRLAAE